MDPKLFFSDPDPTFQEISDPAPDPISDPTLFISTEAIFLCLRILDLPGLIFNAINRKISQLIGLIVVYNL